jgi:hypothetical protein
MVAVHGRSAKIKGHDYVGIRVALTVESGEVGTAGYRKRKAFRFTVPKYDVAGASYIAEPIVSGQEVIDDEGGKFVVEDVTINATRVRVLCVVPSGTVRV